MTANNRFRNSMDQDDGQFVNLTIKLAIKGRRAIAHSETKHGDGWIDSDQI